MVFPMSDLRPVAALLPHQSPFWTVYGPAERAELDHRVALVPVALDAENWRTHPEVCREVEIIFSTWGMARMDEEFLAAFPKLRAVFYAAGAMRQLYTDACWERGLVISSANAINAIPVTEFALAQIILAAKRALPAMRRVRRDRNFSAFKDLNAPGFFRSTVGLISLGAIGRDVARRLQAFDVHVLAYDPFISAEAAADLGVELTSLETLFADSDVISCHTPLLPETRALLRGEHFRAMKPHATFLNTARGGVLDEPALIATLTERPDLTAVLDVTDPEPPAPDSPLYELPNVFLTPHISGSHGPECARMAWAMIAEYDRYVSGQPLLHRVGPGSP